MNLPNKITLSRILGIGLFLFFLLGEGGGYYRYIAAGIFLVLALTDALDGFVARRYNQVTVVGKFIDPLADKLLISAALIFLIGKGVEAWMVFLIVGREFSVLGLRLVALCEGKVIGAGWLGKVKTVSLVAGVMIVLLGREYSYYFLVLAVILTLVSGADYFWKNRKVFR